MVYLLATLTVIFGVRLHIAGNRHPVGHVVKADQVAEIPDAAVAQTGIPQGLDVVFGDGGRRGG